MTKYFGWVETAGGLLKVLLIITLSIAFYAVAGKCEYLTVCGKQKKKMAYACPQTLTPNRWTGNRRQCE